MQSQPQRRALLLLLLSSATLGPLGAQPRELEVNRASRAELESLPGLGPVLVERLLAAREQAPFGDWADLLRRVRGIKAASAARLSAAGLRVQGQAFRTAAASPGQ